MSSFPHLITTKLTTDNFPLWKVQITAYLQGQDLYQYIDGTLVTPPETISTTDADVFSPNPAFASWKKTDKLVLSILFSSISEIGLGHVLSSKNSRALWQALHSLFSHQSQAKQFQSASSPNIESSSQPSTPISSQVHLPLFPQSILGPGPSPTSNQPLTVSSILDTFEITNPFQIPNSATLNSSENPIVIPPRSPIMTRSHTNSSRPRVRMDGTIPYPSRACFSTTFQSLKIPTLTL
ncbi:unnamed protein product [Fraxinus pennsylvanica]|uniref:Retrotransposon Copia-like N-terminal domain-containing protein n=1 Tax=Fraxinus pennsylvanica TaxID=56036 RepID=A0AAD1Z5P4_9LAMI|nr:unnamed protein product [Fraxinus pennsylvanica]